jgi:hypothetical protein
MTFDLNASDAPELIYDELNAFCKHFNIIVDDTGFVHGDMLPRDVMSLGYTLIAIAIASKEYKNTDVDKGVAQSNES